MEKNADLTRYFKCQTDICYYSELYGNYVEEHGNKVLMLFAEIYSFMVEEFGLNMAPELIIQFENSEKFKSWFWNIKHTLGNELLMDPDFEAIGKWIGRGFFLKIILSIVVYNRSLFHDRIGNFDYENLLIRLTTKQKKIIEELSGENYFINNGKKAFEIFQDSYVLLNETVLLDYKNSLFSTVNIIK